MSNSKTTLFFWKCFNYTTKKLNPCIRTKYLWYKRKHFIEYIRNFSHSRYTICEYYFHIYLKMYFFSQEYVINYAIRDVIYIVCELKFKLIFQIRNYIKKSTHTISINPSLIHQRCSSSLCWCAVVCQFVEIVALLGEYSSKNTFYNFLYCFLSFEKFSN